MPFSWQAVGSTPNPLDLVGAVRLNDGRVFALSGDRQPYFYDPIAQTWSLAGGGLSSVSRDHPTMCILGDGKVFVFGRNNPPVGNHFADIYDPVGQTWATSTGFTTPSFPHGCRSYYFSSINKVGIIHINATITLYDPVAQTFSNVNSVPGMFFNTYELVQLLNGNIFICGGGNNQATVYDYASNTFLPVTGTMQQVREGATCAVLDSGNVVIAGGINETTDAAKLVDMFVFASSSLVPIASGVQRFNQFRPQHNLQYASAITSTRALFAILANSYTSFTPTVAQIYKETTNSWSSVPLQIETGPIIKLVTGLGRVLAVPDNVGSSAEILLGEDEDTALVITRVVPDAGSIDGGLPVTIYGEGFDEDAVVTFGGQVAASIVVHNETRITCITPAHVAGFVDVNVANIAMPLSTAMPHAFFYKAHEKVFTNIFDFSGGD